MTDIKPRSRDVTDGIERAGPRAMLRAVGMTDDDWGKSQIGVASSWNEVTPCNMPLDRLAKRAKEGVHAAGRLPDRVRHDRDQRRHLDGARGHAWLAASREIIADSVECVMHSERLDGIVTFAGCDKSLPGMLMAAARLNLPAVFLYGGSILPGQYKDQALDIVERVRGGRGVRRRHAQRERARRDRTARVPDRRIVRGDVHREHDGVGRGGARDVAARRARRRPRSTDRRDDFAFASGQAVMGLLEANIRPRQILTKEAFENAIAVGMALGGSTNLVLHLLAIAFEAQVELELDDFNRVGARVPHIADMKPHGRFHMTDLDAHRRRARRDAGAARRRACCTATA